MSRQGDSLPGESNLLSRREFVRTSGIAATALVAVSASPLRTRADRFDNGKTSPIRLGVASYTFRNFSRAQMIGFLQPLKVSALNAKDVRDHLPADPEQEAAALADYAEARIKLHAAGAIYFSKEEDSDIRSKFEYCKRAGIGVIVAGDPSPQILPRIENFVKEYDIRIAIHNHGPEDKLWASPFDVLKAVKGMDSRIGCCIDVGHAARAGADVVEAIHAAGARLFNVHMKDLADPRDKDSQVAVGDGVLPIRKMFEALIAIKYPGYVDLEYEVHPDDPMPGVISSLAYMRGVLDGMGHSSRA